MKIKSMLACLFFLSLIPASAFALDQCNNTTQCKTLFGSTANDCVDSNSTNSWCQCGTIRCDAKSSSSRSSAVASSVRSSLVASSVRSSVLASSVRSSLVASSIRSSVASSSLGNTDFVGRIALSADGNAHDKDDFGATAMSLALLNAAGLNGKVVHLDFNNNLCLNESAWAAEMRISALGGADKFGFDRSVMFDHQTAGMTDLSTQNLARAINASSANDPLWIIAGGPMETVYRGIAAAQVDKRKFVTVISHSAWNENRDKFHPDYNGRNCGLNNNWSDMVRDFTPNGVKFLDHVFITDQNSTQNGGNDGDWNSPYAKWYWLRDSANPNFKWLYERNDKSTFDISDAGMTYWLLSGGLNGGCKNCGSAEAKRLLENPRF